ncbi:DoxX family protein [Pontibacter ramchanderi]|uniref:Putative membrane protein YphA (DoxX/SURF4 family) n=1 Tax=Pontibacter ramchanderi TaxID=1179743 RepID=A0A2N3U6S6_9BACT|nr:DoxX family protein [Pontibacter ramchanderi]PKV62445.1 putative membrane protein YphA (DoxX/SURF4 family) [Pontibacter ramchanderi]
MNLTQDMHWIEHWADTHHPVWVDFVRMALGIFLFVKGVMFIQDTEALQSIMRNSQFQWVSFGMAHYVAFAHLVGGLLIAMGLVTRIAILFQIPILLGAVFFINPQRGFYSENTELWSSIIVLILLIVFLILGSGRLSVDNLIRRPERDVLY